MLAGLQRWHKLHHAPSRFFQRLASHRRVRACNSVASTIEGSKWGHKWVVKRLVPFSASSECSKLWIRSDKRVSSHLIASSCATCQPTALSNHSFVSPTRGLSIACISRLQSLLESVAEGGNPK